MKQVTIVSKHHQIAQEAASGPLIEFTNQPEVDVMPITMDDLTAPTIGYCAISLDEVGTDVYDIGKAIGFATQKGTIEHEGTEYDQVRHLTILPGWQKFGFGTKLVNRVTISLLESGKTNLAAIVNDASKKAFLENHYEPVAPIIGQTGLPKTLYVYTGGQVQAKTVE